MIPQVHSFAILSHTRPHVFFSSVRTCMPVLMYVRMRMCTSACLGEMLLMVRRHSGQIFCARECVRRRNAANHAMSFMVMCMCTRHDGPEVVHCHCVNLHCVDTNVHCGNGCVCRDNSKVHCGNGRVHGERLAQDILDDVLQHSATQKSRRVLLSNRRESPVKCESKLICPTSKHALFWLSV